ncbi:M23 family metallopeptidase [Jeotgalibacillus sp. R-1-5s-1]|uniref:M23 family metallopeptidase n=1 Tax=Jeotgalibacillus sp. R-1-5s-1 TaxID=2555897 RepID=UPI00106C04CE|nr:M23 family metallopeptidase [Jeotgalibacillus sp. R-1-5s-1]TFD97013.1 M23 family metallopeptidase [Jeotgalibacillus sp. R-1-5s-1]
MIKGDKSQSTLKTKFKRFTQKRWAVPALYLGCGALVLTTVFVLQDRNEEVAVNPQQQVSYEENGQDVTFGPDEAVEVNSQVEKMALPVEDPSAVTVHRAFYDQEASAEEQQNALVVVNQTYYPNLGVDLVQSGESFNVTAAMSGTVTLVQEDPFIGNAVEIEHEDGLVTRYQAVQDIAVASGDKVMQGQVIATSGVSELNPDAGTHVHFEVYKDDVAVDPISFSE